MPLLADAMPTISADGKRYTIALRPGVKFHDGSDLAAEDAVASLKRWMKLASRGKQAAGFIENVEAAGPASVVITLKEPYAPLLSLLAFNNSAAIIIPAKKQDEPMKEFIGTGPYMLKERKADQYIQLTRFAGYKPREGAGDGYGGARHPLLDEVRFVPVPDANTRVEAAVSGQYSYVDAIPVESFGRLKGVASQPVVLKPFGYPVFVFNTAEGAARNLGVRKAIRTALSMEDMLAAAFGTKEFYALDGNIYPPGYVWNTDAGVAGNYNLGDADKAKAAAKAAGYKGEPIRILTSRQYEFHYKMAQVAAEYLKAAGFAVDLQVVDWATLTQRRTDKALWDIYITHSPFLPEPALIGSLSTSSPGWWDTPARKAAVDAFTAEADPAKRAAQWANVQKVIYDEVPFIKIGDFNALSAKSAKLDGVVPAPWPYFWNVTLKK
jgi:peptide/nickel transport system substrate-binding protein